MLERLRFPLAASRGRRYPEPSHAYRNDFQRDRDRIVHARAFRRLEDKTQVFSEPNSDHFRNRLTHTIEVSQIARTVAGTLGLDEDLTEALALAHDFGHPPFAHAGEAELNRQMARFGDRFDHNLHALRLVEGFEQRYARFPGLNLTFEVREGMAKHSRDFDQGEFPELDEYLPGQRPPLEAQLIDLADEIAYCTADLDDAFEAGMLTIDEIGAAVPRSAAIQEAIETQFPGSPPRIQFLEGLRLLIDWLVTGLIEGTVDAARRSGVESLDDVRRHPQRLARLAPEPSETAAQLKRLLYGSVYNSAALQQEREQSMEQVALLFEYFLGNPEGMPEPYSVLAREQAAHRVVCDYIAGMTDGFLRKTVRHLNLSL
ncbi:MAG: dNTP triphosphohydrolase [Bryobacterales bacterium]|nr:dNTP triphosphohydrolase [Bryobacterales bacterium]